jgi:hypothetical protein
LAVHYEEARLPNEKGPKGGGSQVWLNRADVDPNYLVPDQYAPVEEVQMAAHKCTVPLPQDDRLLRSCY